MKTCITFIQPRQENKEDAWTVSACSGCFSSMEMGFSAQGCDHPGSEEPWGGCDPQPILWSPKGTLQPSTNIFSPLLGCHQFYPGGRESWKREDGNRASMAESPMVLAGGGWLQPTFHVSDSPCLEICLKKQQH